MTKIACLVCGKMVRDGDQTEHLKTDHLGPHYFWFNTKKYRTTEPSIPMAELKRIAKVDPMYHAFEERGGENIYFGDAIAVDLTREPHFWAVPYATTFCG